jgi:hypothetical protein
MVNLI